MKIPFIVRTVVALLVCAGFLSACDVQTYDDAVASIGGTSPPPPPPPPPGPPPPPPPPPPPAAFGPNFSEIQLNVFTPTCAGCHSGGAPPEGLNLQDGVSYAMLVGIVATQDPNFQRVEPFDPDNSYLIQKLEGNASGGSQIHPPGGALPQPTIDTIRQWITDGAIDDTAPPPPAPIRVTSLSPTPNVTLTAPPTQIIAGFDRDLDATTINANTFILEASGGDNTFGDGNEVQIAAASITVPGANPQTAVFDLGATVLADERYRVTLEGVGASVIMDLDGNALDGEFSGAFPSGNGVEGGDFFAAFTINTPVVIGPTLDQIQTIVFGPTCATAGCHTGPAGGMLPAGLDLSDADASFMSLVGVDSTQQMGTLRVDPFSANTSYLIMKIEGAAAVGQIMPPPPRQPLDPTVIANIRQWIDDGALR